MMFSMFTVNVPAAKVVGEPGSLGRIHLWSYHVPRSVGLIISGRNSYFPFVSSVGTFLALYLISL